MLSLPDGSLVVHDSAPQPAGTLPSGIAVISTQGEARHVVNDFDSDTFEWVHDNGTTIYIAVADAGAHFHGVMSYSLPEFAPLAQVNLFAANAQHNAIDHGLVISGIAYHEAQIFVSSLQCYDHDHAPLEVPEAQPPPCVIVIDVAADGSMAFRQSFGQAWLQAPTSIVAFQDLSVGAARLIIADSINTDSYDAPSPALHVCAIDGTRLRTLGGFACPDRLVMAHGRLYVSNAPPYELREEVRGGTRLLKRALRRIHALTLPTLEPDPVVDDILKAMAPLSRGIVGSTARGASRRAIFAHGDLLCYVRSDNTVRSIRVP